MIKALLVGSFIFINASGVWAQNPMDPNVPDLADPMPTLPESTGLPPEFSLNELVETFSYNPTGKRDPFQPYLYGEMKDGAMAGPVFPLQKFDIDQLTLSGIIWGVRTSKALFIDPNGQSHIVTLNDRIGKNNGFIAEIREGEVIVVETFALDGKSVSRPRIVKLENQLGEKK